MKKILFPTDFSANANHALEYAIQICKTLGSELIIFHSCHINVFAYQNLNEETNEEKIIFSANKEMTEYCNAHSAELTNIKYSKLVKYGLAGDTILESAKKLEVNMIIMGTKGQKGLESALIGSNTLSVINKVECPVLVIPEKSKIKSFNQIVFATDYRENDIESISVLVSIAKLWNAKITILHVTDFIDSASIETTLYNIYKENVLNKINYKNISFKVLKGINHSKELNEYLIENNIDLLALSTRKKNLFTRIFDSSFTKKMLYHTTIPVLVFHLLEKEDTNED